MIKAIIIDDEPASAQLLQLKLEKYCKDVNIVAVCHKTQESIDAIKRLTPHLVFLDIEMPGMNGFTLLERLKPINFSVIFTTAYEHYAIKALRFNALDYLLKPVDIEELTKAVENYALHQKSSDKQIEQIQYLLHKASNLPTVFDKMALPTMEGVEFVYIKDIIRAESDGNYTTFYFTDKRKITVSKNIGEYESLLRDNHFMRIHNSHLVNLYFVLRYIKGDGGQAVLLDGTTIDVSRRRKDEFLLQMGTLR